MCRPLLFCTVDMKPSARPSSSLPFHSLSGESAVIFLGFYVISLPSVLSLRAEHPGRLGAAWSQASPALKACLPLTFLSSTNSFSAAVRLLISSSYLQERQDSVGDYVSLRTLLHSRKTLSKRQCAHLRDRC